MDSTDAYFVLDVSDVAYFSPPSCIYLPTTSRTKKLIATLEKWGCSKSIATSMLMGEI